jgi:hypothetical protein
VILALRIATSSSSFGLGTLVVEAEADCPDSVDSDSEEDDIELTFSVAFFAGAMAVFVAGAVKLFVNAVRLFVKAVAFFVNVMAADFFDAVDFLREVADFVEVDFVEVAVGSLISSTSISVDGSVEIAGSSARTGGSCVGFLRGVSESVY